jgi:hypothetical protein
VFLQECQSLQSIPTKQANFRRGAQASEQIASSFINKIQSFPPGLGRLWQRPSAESAPRSGASPDGGSTRNGRSGRQVNKAWRRQGHGEGARGRTAGGRYPQRGERGCPVPHHGDARYAAGPASQSRYPRAGSDGRTSPLATRPSATHPRLSGSGRITPATAGPEDESCRLPGSGAGAVRYLGAGMRGWRHGHVTYHLLIIESCCMDGFAPVPAGRGATAGVDRSGNDPSAFSSFGSAAASARARSISID